MEQESQAYPASPPDATDEVRTPLSPEQERDHQRLTYQLCRLGFGITSLSLILACFSSLLVLSIPFGGRALAVWILNTRWWHWLDVPIVWGSLIGTYLLWGRWNERGWQRRAGLLLVMCGVDMALWFLEHGNDLGLQDSEIGHQWLRNQLGQALGWAEFTLIAGLACDLLAHLGIEHAPEAGKATRSLAATGAVVWMIQFTERTAWNLGWPLQDQGIRSVETVLLYMGTHMIWTITLIQVTALTITTTRQTSRVLAEMEREDRQDDLFLSSTESDGFSSRDSGDPWTSSRDRQPW